MSVQPKAFSIFDLRGKTALVTGARGGIGQAISVGLAQAGADLILLGRGKDFTETETYIREAGRKSSIVTADVSDPRRIRETAETIIERSSVDILVNNAGIITRSPAREYPLEEWDKVLNTNLNGLFALTQTIARPMLERGGGKIVNIASLLSLQGGIRVPAYAASKHAVAGLTKALSNEWASENVQVNAIAPGYIETENTEALRSDPERRAEITGRIPAGKWGRPADLVGAAVFLASPASDYVNGHILVVDGGWMAR